MSKAPPPPPAPRGAPPPPPGSAPAAAKAPTGPLNFRRGKAVGRAQRIVLYGTGGIGKSTLASLLPNPVFLDLESGTEELDTVVLIPSSYAEVRAMLASPALDEFETIIVDSITRLESYAEAHVLATRRHKGSPVDSLEGYGYGRGFRHLFEAFALLLADLDRHAEAGRHVCLIAHEEATRAPNPAGEDWLRFEPRLQNKANGNIRRHVIEWAGHVLHLEYDVVVDDGKARGGGTVSLYATETPTKIAKSRRLSQVIPVAEGDAAVWDTIIGKTHTTGAGK